MSLSKETWTCRECGGWNAPWRTTCGRCEDTNNKHMYSRRDRQYEDSMRIMVYSGAILVASLFIIIMLSLLGIDIS